MKKIFISSFMVCAALTATSASAALNLTASGSGTVSSSSTNDLEKMIYSSSGPSGNWLFGGTATTTGAQTFNYSSIGNYAYFQVIAAAEAFSGLTTKSLYSTGPQNCCTSPSNGFSYTGSVTLDLVAGQAYGFRLSGSNFDRNPGMGGTLSVAAVPEPATWAMMLVGFGMVGAASRYRRRVAKVTFA